MGVSAPAEKLTQHGAARSDHPSQLVEEGDHVAEADEVERAVLVGQRRAVRRLEADAIGELRWGQPARLGQHLFGDVGADDLGLGEATRDRECAAAGPGSKVERPARRRLEPLQRRLVRAEGARGCASCPTAARSGRTPTA